MPQDNDVVHVGQFSGNAGNKIFDRRHNDIDSSHIRIIVHSGQVHAYLREAIWYDWETRLNTHVSATLDEEVWVDSGCCDGDHRLRVWADVDNTSCDIDFDSEDW
jgi:hypothetical protein